METVPTERPISTDMLEAFVRVAEQGGVSAAALDLGIGKSLVSKRVAQLEAAVKTTLFARSTRKVVLTPAGEAYLDFARRALVEVAAAEERLSELRTGLSGQIRVTAPISWGQRVLARRLPAFLVRHPGIELELQLADRVMDLAGERIDLALRWSPLAPPGLVAVPVCEVPWVIAGAPAYLSQAGVPAHPDELAAHVCMGYWREPTDDAWTFVRGDERVAVRARGRFHANHPEAVADAAIAGLGLGLLPRYVCDDALADGRLVAVLPDWAPVTRFGTRIVAVGTPERLRQARHRALLEHLRASLS